MKLAPHSDNVLLGKGSVYFARRAEDGTLGPYRHLGNVTTFELTTTDDVLDLFESMTAAAGLYKRVTRRRDVVLRLVGNEFTSFNLAMALMGDEDAGQSQAGTEVTDEILTESAVKGGYYKTAMLGPITGVSLTAYGNPLVLGTDYVITNPDIGIIQILENAPNVTEGEDITITYTPTAYSALTRVKGGTAGVVNGRVLFVPDPTTGPRMMIEVWQVSVTPDGALGVISDEFASMALSMAVESDLEGHPTEPLYRVTYLPDE